MWSCWSEFVTAVNGGLVVMGLMLILMHLSISMGSYRMAILYLGTMKVVAV